MDEIRRSIRRFTIAVSQIDAAYCCLSPSRVGARPSELWLLYALDDGAPHSQKQICEEWGIPRTTLNTTMKQMESAGFLTLSRIPGSRREMRISLTESGRVFARQVLQPIHEAEDEALARTAERCSLEFIEALSCYSGFLRASLQEKTAQRKSQGET